MSHPGQPPQPARRLEILVLDSSFNPPTKAHEAMVRLAPSAVNVKFDATLLLLATNNMDKGAVDGAKVTNERRLLMESCAKGLVGRGDAENIAVATTDAGRFLEKAACLDYWVRKRTNELRLIHLTDPPARFHFLLGWDTVIRFFDAKYYPAEVRLQDTLAPFFTTSTLIVADRPLPNGHPEAVVKAMEGFKDGVKEIPDWVGTGLEEMSSTEVRKRVGVYWKALEVGAGVEEAEKAAQEFVSDEVWTVVKEAGLYRG
jgi:nicotinamide-nucleotide adenylyltransferase